MDQTTKAFIATDHMEPIVNVAVIAVITNGAAIGDKTMNVIITFHFSVKEHTSNLFKVSCLQVFSKPW